MAGTSTGSGPYTISVTGDGYYFVKDKAPLPTDTDEQYHHQGDAETRYILQVVNDVTVAAKSSTVESEKKVQDINDSTGTALGSLADSADYDIGDKIPYTLTAKLPANYSSFEKYYLQFVDDMSKGLTLDADSVKIYYGSSDTTGTSITLTEATGSSYNGGKKYTYTIADLKTVASSLTDGDVVKITYTATLNKDAVIGAEGKGGMKE